MRDIIKRFVSASRKIGQGINWMMYWWTRQIYWRIGLKRGIEFSIKQFILDNLEENVPKERILAKLRRRFKLTARKAKMYYNRFAE